MNEARNFEVGTEISRTICHKKNWRYYSEVHKVENENSIEQ